MEEECEMEAETVGGGFLADKGSCDREDGVQEIDEVTMGGTLEEALLPPAVETGNGKALAHGCCGFLGDGGAVPSSCEGDKAFLEDGLGSSPVLDVRGDTRVSRNVPLDWKKAVLGGGGNEEHQEGRKLGADAIGAQDEEVQRSAVGGGRISSLTSDKVVGDDVWNGRNCRGIVFHDKSEDFLGEDGITVVVDEVAASDCEVRLGRALVGKIFGRSVPFGFLNRDLRRKWGKFGRLQMSLIGKNCFVCFFESEAVRDSVLRGGPWFVGNQLVGVDKWTADFDPSSIKGFASPIWIRLPGLPLHYWSDSNLGRIASRIGVPLWVDEATSFWGRTEFARVCVKLDFAKKLPTGVWVKSGSRKFFQPVLYEGIEQLCFKCGIIGHVEGDCVEDLNGVGHGGVHGSAWSKEGKSAVGGSGLGVEQVNTLGQGGGGLEDGAAAGRLGVQVGGGSSGGVSNEEAVGKKVGVDVGKETMGVNCKEDRGYGGWILVDRRKPHKLKFQQAPASRFSKGGSVGGVKGGVVPGRIKKGGDSIDGVMRFAAVKSGHGNDGGEGAKAAAGKQFIVYSRVGEKSQSNGKAAGGKFRRKGGGEGGLRKAAAACSIAGGKVGGAGVFACRGEVDGNILLEGDGGLPLLEEENGRKRRRGTGNGVSGGDASPKVV